MLALKLLHLSAVIVWSGGLLYLTGLLAALRVPAAGAHGVLPQGLSRLLFTRVVTPAALVAIASGSVIFLVNGPHAAWLVVKLFAVGGLVLAHGGCGMLVLRAERGEAGGPWSRAIAALVVLDLATIAWLAVGKPF